MKSTMSMTSRPISPRPLGFKTPPRQGAEHYHAGMKKEHPDWNFCPMCNASLVDAAQTGIFGLLLTHPDNRFVVSISLSPELGTGTISPFSMDGITKFPVWAEPAQIGSPNLAKERLFEETIIQHILPAFRNGFRLTKQTGTEKDNHAFSEILIKYAQKDLAEQSIRNLTSFTLNESLEPVARKRGSQVAPTDSPFDSSPDLSMNAGSDVTNDNMVATGVFGFDTITGGGVPKNKITLLSGGSGLGKTVFAIQFLLEGVKRNEVGILALTDERPVDLLEETESLGIPLLKSVKEEKIVLIVRDSKREYRIKGIEIQNAKDNFELYAAISRSVKKFGARRIVIDSFTDLISDPGEERVRRLAAEATEELERLQCTVVATGDLPTSSKSFSHFGVEERFVSGLVVFKSKSIHGRILRCLYVPKMKGADHNLQKFVYDIEPRFGLRVVEPLQHYASQVQQQSSQNLRDALEIANVLKSLAATSIANQYGSKRQDMGQTGLSSSERLGVSYVQPGQALSAPKSESEQNATRISSNPPKQIQIDKSKLTSAAHDNPWTSIIDSLDETTEANTTRQ